MIRLALSNVFYRKTRAFLSVLAVAVQIALLLVLVGLSSGTVKESGERIENIRSDIIVLPPGAQLLLGMSTAVMPLEPVRAVLEATEGVAAATPIVFTTTSSFGGYGLVFGIDPPSYDRSGRARFEYVEGQSFERPYDLVVDQRLARSRGLVVGQEVDLLNQRFRVSGIVRDGAGVRLYVPIETLQDLIGRGGKASMFFARAQAPERIEEIVARLEAMPGFKGYKIFASSRYTELLGMNTFGLKEFHAAVTSIAVGFGFIVILLSMYTNVLERTRQIGILKSLGAGRWYILREVMLEALILSLVGLPLGFMLAHGIRIGLLTAYPTLNILFSAAWTVNAGLLGLGSALLGAVYPAVRASGVDPVLSLSYE